MSWPKWSYRRWTDQIIALVFRNSELIPVSCCSIHETEYRIYSINRPGRLLNFWTLIVGANSRLGAYSNNYGMIPSAWQSIIRVLSIWWWSNSLAHLSSDSYISCSLICNISKLTTAHLCCAVYLSSPYCKIQTTKRTNRNSPFHCGPVQSYN